MPRRRLRWSDAEQRTEEFRHDAGKWGRRIWIPACAVALVFQIYVALRLRTLSMFALTALNIAVAIHYWVKQRY